MLSIEEFLLYHRLSNLEEERKLKKLFSLCLVVFLFLLTACGNEDALEKETPTEDEVVSEQQEESAVEEEAEEQESEEQDDAKDDESAEALADEIEKAIKEIAEEDFRKTEITEVRVNKDLSVEEERYIVLVDLRWDVQNKPKTTNEMLQQYSDHLAAKMTDFDLIYEFVQFWQVPYLKEDEVILKKTYENTNDGMFKKHEVNMIN